MSGGKAPFPLIKDGKRHDGRGPLDLRPIEMKVGILHNANGSAWVKYGGTEVIAAAYGPREPPKFMSLPDRALLRCRYHMAPFSTDERKSPAPSRREVELSKVIREALEPIVLTHLFPRTVIDVFIEVIRADGGTRTAAITAASLALADAGVPMKDLVAGVAVGKVDGQLVLDIDQVEDNYGEADMPVAGAVGLNKVVLLQLNGKLSPKEFEEAMKMAWIGIKKIYEMERNVLKESVKKEVVF